jgi:hypothetical protein
MQHSGVGLPQLDFAPRLLAHVYFFNVDEELHTRTNGEFVRWKDGIDAGVDFLRAGRRMLASLQRVVNSHERHLDRMQQSKPTKKKTRRKR